MRSSLVRELLKLTTEADVISFAAGLPGADLFPIEEFQAASARVLANHGAEALRYQHDGG